MTPTTAATSVTVMLDVTSPFDADSMLAFLRARAVLGVEVVHGSCYARTVRLSSGPGCIRLTMRADGVEGRFTMADPGDLATCIARSRELLDLDADSRMIDRHLGRNPTLAASVRDHPGLRVPGHVDGFEVAVRAVVGQQISVAGARTILGRLVAEYGEDYPRQEPDVAPPSWTGVGSCGAGLARLFPAPSRLAMVSPDDLPMPRARGRALLAVADALASKALSLDRTASVVKVRSHLLSLPGIGPWTADYIALRALGAPDVFLASDLGVRRGLARLGLADAGVDEFAAWSPWRSYALMHVWKALEDN